MRDENWLPLASTAPQGVVAPLPALPPAAAALASPPPKRRPGGVFEMKIQNRSGK
jgi:hypothetical protein